MVDKEKEIKIPKGNITKKVNVKFHPKEKEEMKTEKIPMLLIYKEDQLIKTDASNDVNDFELYGFLKLFIERMGKQLTEDIQNRTDDEELI